MVGRFRPIVLVTVKKVHGLLDDKEERSFTRVMAHVTEVNGSQLQNDLFGKTHDFTWVARVHGNYDAKYVFFAQLGVQDKYVDQSAYHDVIQIRKHATRTDIYFADDREVTTNELEQ